MISTPETQSPIGSQQILIFQNNPTDTAPGTFVSSRDKDRFFTLDVSSIVKPHCHRSCRHHDGHLPTRSTGISCLSRACLARHPQRAGMPAHTYMRSLLPLRLGPAVTCRPPAAGQVPLLPLPTPLWDPALARAGAASRQRWTGVGEQRPLVKRVPRSSFSFLSCSSSPHPKPLHRNPATR